MTGNPREFLVEFDGERMIMPIPERRHPDPRSALAIASYATVVACLDAIVKPIR